MTVRTSITPSHLAISAHATAIDAVDGEAPEWVCIMPAGKFTGVDGRGPYENKDPAAIVTASMAPRGMIPLDYNHQTVFACVQGGDAPAAAWFDKMEVREGAIWGHLTDWTPKGEQSVAGKEYRFVSPTFQHTKAGVITRIDSVGLVNNPNLAGLPAIASQTGVNTPMDELLEQLRAALGLSADADQSAILASCRASQATASALTPLVTALGLPANTTASTLVTAVNAKITATTGSPDPSKFVPMSAFSELQTQVAALTQAKTEGDAQSAVAAAMAAGKLSPAMKDWAIDYASTNAAGFKAWEEKAPVIVPPGGTGLAKGAPIKTDGGLTDTERSVCAALGLTHEAYLAQQKKDAA